MLADPNDFTSSMAEERLGFLIKFAGRARFSGPEDHPSEVLKTRARDRSARSAIREHRGLGGTTPTVRRT